MNFFGNLLHIRCLLLVFRSWLDDNDSIGASRFAKRQRTARNRENAEQK